MLSFALHSPSSRGEKGARVRRLSARVGGILLFFAVTGLVAACGIEGYEGSGGSGATTTAATATGSDGGSGGSGATTTAATATGGGGGSGGSGATTTAGTGAGGKGTGGCDSSTGSAGLTLDPAWTSCDGPGQCVLRIATCCADCKPKLIETMLAIRSDASSAVKVAVCESECKTPDSCGIVLCVHTTNYNVAVCRAGSCEGVDIREDELSACATDDDCTLRWGVHCCEYCAGGPTDLVAVKKTPSFSEALCGPQESCSSCAPAPYPANASPVCNSAGHCEVKLAN
jgi:hypothetical protein